MYREQVNELQGMELRYVAINTTNNERSLTVHVLFRGHTIKVFLTGDYEFLCRMYGLSGASGMRDYF